MLPGVWSVKVGQMGSPEITEALESNWEPFHAALVARPTPAGVFRGVGVESAADFITILFLRKLKRKRRTIP